MDELHNIKSKTSSHPAMPIYRAEGKWRPGVALHPHIRQSKGKHPGHWESPYTRRNKMDSLMEKQAKDTNTLSPKWWRAWEKCTLHRSPKVKFKQHRDTIFICHIPNYSLFKSKDVIPRVSDCAGKYARLHSAGVSNWYVLSGKSFGNMLQKPEK